MWGTCLLVCMCVGYVVCVCVMGYGRVWTWLGVCFYPLFWLGYNIFSLLEAGSPSVLLQIQTHILDPHTHTHTHTTSYAHTLNFTKAHLD